MRSFLFLLIVSTGVFVSGFTGPWFRRAISNGIVVSSFLMNQVNLPGVLDVSPIALHKSKESKESKETKEIKETNLEGSDSTRISVERNNVYFYGEVTGDSCEQLKEKLLELDNNGRMLKMWYDIDPPPINLHIQSVGGSLMDTLYITDFLDSMFCSVNTYVDGYAASAASLMSVVGDKRYMTKNSMILIHQLSSGSQGKYDEMDDNMKNLDMLMEKIKGIYAARTNIPLSQLDELLQHDLWLDAETCKSYGLVDEIK